MPSRWDRIKAAVRGGVRSVGQWVRPGYPSPPTRSTADWIKQYGSSPRFAPVTKVATDMSIADGRLVRIGADGSQTELDTHSFLSFWRNPCPLPELSAAAFWRLMEIYLYTTGEAAAVIERDEQGLPASLWPVPPHWLVEIPYSGHPYYRVRSSDGQQRIVHMRDMYMQRELNPYDPYRRGLGQMEQLADEIETDEYMAKYAKRFFFNNATPEVLIVAPGIKQEQVDRFEESWFRKYSGIGNARRPSFIPGQDVSVHRLTDSQRELDFGASRKDQRDIINQHVGVPPEIMGITENSNRATATQSKIIYAENVLMPRLLARQDAVNGQLVQPFGRDLMWIYDDIVPEDQEFKLQTVNEGLARGVLTANEWREAMGYDPHPNGDALYLPFSIIVTKPEELSSGASQGASGTEPVGASPEYYSLLKSAKAAKRPPGPRSMRAADISEQMLQAQERAAAPLIEKFFRAQMDDVLHAMRGNAKADTPSWLLTLHARISSEVTDDGVLAGINEALGGLLDWGAQSRQLESILRPIWTSAFEAGAHAIEDGYGIHAIRKPELTASMLEQGFSRIDSINETTRSELARSIAAGVQGGESAGELAKRVQEHLPGILEGRARVIAMNEAHTSLMTGQLEQMKLAGIREKVWVTRKDEKVRASHKLMHGERALLNERFTNGLMYPGDPTVNAPGETINCRCSAAPADFD